MKHDDGIYFGLPEDEYHAIPRLSSSGIKEILVSIPTYWANSDMNPHRDEVDRDTPARVLGHAYHTAIFEPEEMESRFACEPDPADYPDALLRDADVKAELKERGEAMTKAGENALPRAYRLVSAGFDGEIWAIVQDEFQIGLGNRQAIAPQYWNQIQRDIQRIKDNPEIHDLITGGEAEVSVLWTDQETGIKMKSRFDKLKPDLFLDLKSFANSVGKPVNQFIVDQFKYNRYYVQARLYQTAVDMIRELDLKIQGKATAPQTDLIAKIKARHALCEVWYLFQEKGGVPNLLARRIKLQAMPAGVEAQEIGAEGHKIKPMPSALACKADVDIRRAIHLYGAALEAYGTNKPWYPFDMIGSIDDEDFSNWFLDGMPA